MSLSEKLHTAGVNPVLVTEAERLERELEGARITSAYWHNRARELETELYECGMGDDL